MRPQITLEIGGIGIAIQWEGSELSGWPHPLYRDFLREGDTQVSLRVHCNGDLPAFEVGETIFNARENGWNLFWADGRYLIETFEMRSPGRKNLIALLDPSFTSGDVYVRPKARRGRPTWSPTNLMRPFGELVLLYHLSHWGGMVVHGLGVDDGGRGLAFVGPSGAGKSTLARLWKEHGGAVILSDEHVIMRRLGERFWLFGTPWPGGAFEASAKAVPLERVYFIAHAPTNQCSTPGAMAAFKALFTELFLPFWDRVGLERTTGVCEELITRVDCKHLGFVNDSRVISFLRNI